MAYDEPSLRYLIDELHAGSGLPLLASGPQEIISRIVDFAGFNGESPRLAIATIDQAWSSMFAGGGQPAAIAAHAAHATIDGGDSIDQLAQHIL